MTLNMDAYYYRFDKTGDDDIDLLLSAVACAGKAFHHTDQWREEVGEWEPHEGNAPADWIQNAANKSAKEVQKIKKENEELQTKFASSQAEIAEWERTFDDDLVEAKKKVPILEAKLDAANTRITEHKEEIWVLKDAIEEQEAKLDAAQAEAKRMREALEKLSAIWIGGLLTCPACKAYSPGSPVVHKPNCWLQKALKGEK